MNLWKKLLCSSETPKRMRLFRAFRRLNILSLILMIASLNFSAKAEWENSLKPKGNPIKLPLPVVVNGQPVAGILCPEDATQTDQLAAQELQKWIYEITGATVPIYLGSAPKRNIIIRTDSKLKEDGYSIRANDTQVLLWGGSKRGLMNGVFALLEEDLGCRFYSSNSIVIPKTNTLIIAPITRTNIPPLRIRDPFYSCAFDPEWSLRNRTSAPHARVAEEYGGRMDYDGMFVHTANQIVPPDKYFKTNPDYFAQLKDGTRTTKQLCATHPEVAKLAIAHVREVLKANKNTEILSISKNDNTTVCLCERCVKLRTEEGSDMANQLILVNAVAEAIEKESPKVTIDTLAYLETIKVPKTIRPRKNVAIRLCNDSVGSWNHPFTPAEQCDIAPLLKAWSEVHNRIYIWDYNVNFGHYLAPMPNLDVMAANVRFWMSNKAEGVMLQGGYQGPTERDELKCWVTSKLMWDPTRDEKALTKDFIWGHYGKAAPALEEYEALLNKMRVDFAEQMQSPKKGIHYPMDAPFITQEFVDGATDLFRKAKELAGRDAALIRRIERAMLPILYVQCVRGPTFTGKKYSQVVSDFERIARQEHITRLSEHGPDFEARLDEYKKAGGMINFRKLKPYLIGAGILFSVVLVVVFSRPTKDSAPKASEKPKRK